MCGNGSSKKNSADIFNLKNMTKETSLINLPKITKFIGHKIITDEPQKISAVLYEYLMTGNGVFVRAERDEFKVSLPVSGLKIKGLPCEKAGICWKKPRIRENLWKEILENARDGSDIGDFKEDVFVIYWSEKENLWKCRHVGRNRTGVATIADDTLEEYKYACIELHTHPAGAIHFSRADDLDESGKFRIFGILIDIYSQTPKIRFRCGVYEHFVQIPAEFIGSLPNEIIDLNKADFAIGKILK
jgi:PRTRC genetic system protein A